jgi:predicted nuclease with TOPRIM domain
MYVSNPNAFPYQYQYTYNNPDYDPEKAKSYKEEKEKYKKLVIQYIEIKKDINKTKSEIKQIYKELYSIAKRGSKDDPELDNIANRINAIFDKYDEADNEIHSTNESVDCSFLESCLCMLDISVDMDSDNIALESVDLEDVIGITPLEETTFESYANDNIDKRTMNRILSNINSNPNSKYVDFKLAVYEKELSGDISVKERNQLFNILDNRL